MLGASGLIALAGATPARGIDWDYNSHIHVTCWPSEGVSRSAYSGGTSNSYMSTRGQLYKWLSGAFRFSKENTAFSGYGPSGVARVALHLPQDAPLYQWGKHVSSFDMNGTHEKYSDYTSWVVCS